MCFVQRIQRRLIYNVFVALAGIAAVAAGAAFCGTLLSYFLAGFYSGTGGTLVAYSVVTIIKQIRLMHDEEKRKKAEIDENDERTRFINERTSHITSAVMIPLLYIATIVSGFLSQTIFLVLLSTTAVMVLVRLIAYWVIKYKY